MKHIIRECSYPEFEYYFDTDYFSEAGGDYNYTLFIFTDDYYGYCHHYNGLNVKEYKIVRERMEAIIDGFEEVKEGYTNYDGDKITYKEVMEDNNIEYNSMKCHRLKIWANDANIDDLNDFAEFLTIITGEKWNCERVCGYCQGDFADVVYCVKHYPDKQARIAGELYIGCGKEFKVIDVEIDENGEVNETDIVSGYYVADCEACKDEDYKRLVCDQAEIDEDETQLELIDGYSTYTTYSYRMA